MSAVLTPGVRFQGATYVGICTAANGSLYALLLLDEKPAQRLGWNAAMAWADGLHASLPTRTEAALLYALLPNKLDKSWHWTSETCGWDASHAWVCHFGDGYQGNDRKSYEGSAVAVRLIPVTT
jgi:hypothetical protein